MTEENNQLVKAWQETRDPQIIGEIFELNKGLEVSVVNRFHFDEQDRNDLHQVAAVGLLKAAHRFNPDRGEFSTYATICMAKEISRYLRTQGGGPGPLKVHDADKILRLSKAEEGLSDPSETAEISRLTGFPPEKVERLREIRKASRATKPLTSITEERIADPRGDFTEKADRRIDIAEALRTLNRQQRVILELCFLRDWVQDRIAERLGCRGQNVSEQKIIALEKLRESERLEGYED